MPFALLYANGGDYAMGTESQVLGRGVCLVACVKAKRKEASRAEDLYISQLFRKCRRVAEGKYGVWYILSAEYGLLEPSRVVEPYEKTLRASNKKTFPLQMRD